MFDVETMFEFSHAATLYVKDCIKFRFPEFFKSALVWSETLKMLQRLWQSEDWLSLVMLRGDIDDR